jgi:BirA family biotin operon repressor/biotin-[acetyl-CoA-carboxylase] ligase
MDEKILRILRMSKDRFITAQEISRLSSVSKIVVSRYIHKLRQEGYDIQFQPHWGYKLLTLPDKLFASELKWQLNTKIIGRKILSYNVVDSTNIIAFSLAEQNAPEGTVVFAEGQNKGRGRFGRRWVSPKSKGIYLSIVLRPKVASSEAALITLLAAVSCAETIRKACGLRALIRWPNDILVNSKKVCGILTEMQTEDNKVKFIVLGIGINVYTAVSKLPLGASSLCTEAGTGRIHISRLELARELLRRIDREYILFKRRGSTNIIVQWQNLSALSGKRIKVYFPHRTIEGQAQDIDEQGALIVRLDNGFKQHIIAGDVVKIR